VGYGDFCTHGDLGSRFEDGFKVFKGDDGEVARGRCCVCSKAVSRVSFLLFGQAFGESIHSLDG
jgi:hypothetical protein